MEVEEGVAFIWATGPKKRQHLSWIGLVDALPDWLYAVVLERAPFEAVFMGQLPYEINALMWARMERMRAARARHY